MNNQLQHQPTQKSNLFIPALYHGILTPPFVAYSTLDRYGKTDHVLRYTWTSGGYVEELHIPEKPCALTIATTDN